MNTLIQTKEISKSYDDLQAVDNLSMEVVKGEIFGFLGPNGAGKTTTISMLCGLLKPDMGLIQVFGQNVHSAPDSFHHIGYCPQQIVLWSRLTCLEQLVFMGTQYGLPVKQLKQRGRRLLEEMGLLEKANKLASTLSGGMQRRLNLIMALMHEPDILILDEPEAGLDPQSRVLVREKIKKWVQEGNRAVIMTSHNMDEVERMADRVAIIDHGKLLVLDTPQHLKESIGSGDVLEISVNMEGADLKSFAFNNILDKDIAVDIGDRKLSFRSTDLVKKVPAILEQITAHTIDVSEVQLRSNTLEDVFIALTGRGLRE